jgi:hypothetical protein
MAKPTGNPIHPVRYCNRVSYLFRAADEKKEMK